MIRTRARPTIAECEGVAIVSGADGSADDSFCGELVNDDWQVRFDSNSSNSLHGNLSAEAGARLER